MTVDNRFAFFDAHLDQFGPQSGGWGSAEQLEGMDRLGGALRVLFCEREGQYPEEVETHLSECRVIIDDLYPQQMPRHWVVPTNYKLHVEGLESPTTEAEVDFVLSALATYDVFGATPIYHTGNPLGGCSKESGIGLTDLGHYMLKRMVERGWWIDCAHMSHQSMWDTVQLMRPFPNRMVCYTHGGIQHSEVNHPLIVNGNMERMLTEKEASAIIFLGGIVCLSPARPFYERLQGPFIDHIQMLGELSAWTGVGIGTDYGGILDEWRLPGCRTVADTFESVANALLQAGLAEWQVRNVVGQNVQRFFLAKQ